MKIKHLIHLIISSGALLARCCLAQEPTLLSSDPDKAWEEVERVHEAIQRPADWEQRKPTTEEIATFQKQVRETARAFAAKAREFIKRFPTNENVGDARITVVWALSHAVAAGDTNAEAEVRAFSDTVLADKSISEESRADIFCYSRNVTPMKKVGMRLFTEGREKLKAEFEKTKEETTRAALKQFPTVISLYTGLLSEAAEAEGERKEKLTRQVLNAPAAPSNVKILAEHILKGTPLYTIGKPLDIRFKALDGRNVDLAKLVGKIVLVNFWSTECGPCIAEMPAIKAAYEKYHARGFEVVGISLDRKEGALRRFITEKGLLWPQFFDGQGFECKFAIQFGVFAIPTTWLVDKRGNLRTTEAHGQIEEPLDKVIESLLAEPVL
jgi:peroxiredoxin